MLTKRDNESARLREQRDQFQAEINERRTRESAKFASILEFKALAENRAVRDLGSTLFECQRLSGSVGTHRGS